MLEEIERAIAREYQWPGYFEAEKKTISLDQKVLKSLVGEYAAKSGITYEITESNQKLFLHLKNQTPIELLAESDSKFFIAGLNSQIIFDRAPDGSVKSLTLQQEGGGPVSAEKKQ